MRGKEAVEQCRAYLEQTNVVARELGKLTSVSVRTPGFLSDADADAKLLAIQVKSNEILALQRQLGELWGAALG